MKVNFQCQKSIECFFRNSLLLTLFHLRTLTMKTRNAITRLLVVRFSKNVFSLKDFEKFYLKIVRALFWTKIVKVMAFRGSRGGGQDPPLSGIGLTRRMLSRSVNQFSALVSEQKRCLSLKFSNFFLWFTTQNC